MNITQVVSQQVLRIRCPRRETRMNSDESCPSFRRDRHGWRKYWKRRSSFRCTPESICFENLCQRPDPEVWSALRRQTDYLPLPFFAPFASLRQGFSSFKGGAA
ncbi:MAG TPA: hypothetical protein VJ396_08160 [Acidiferrobacterales bacterium]|nr:hypothetical protein [Acidiferrobacterales bacterium]